MSEYLYPHEANREPLDYVWYLMQKADVLVQATNVIAEWQDQVIQMLDGEQEDIDCQLRQAGS